MINSERMHGGETTVEAILCFNRRKTVTNRRDCGRVVRYLIVLERNAYYLLLASIFCRSSAERKRSLQVCVIVLIFRFTVL